jgi:hypothetical protein
MLTLVFAIALGGNVSSYIRANMHQDWHYDFNIGMNDVCASDIHICSYCIGDNDYVVCDATTIDHLLD